MIDRRTLFAAGALLPFAACAQEAPRQEAPKEETWSERWERMLREDWPMLSRYAEENRKVLASGATTNIVFMGDSITEGWPDKAPGFWKPGRVCRGISGQTTGQMVLRMLADVVQLKPRYVHIMAGTNDIAGNTGPMTVAQSEDNLRAMVQLAKANGIEVLLASVPPADHFPWREGLEVVGPIRAITAWAKANAASLGATFVDYTPALADAKGAMKPGYAEDGVHPTAAGYAAMAGVIEPILAAKGV